MTEEIKSRTEYTDIGSLADRSGVTLADGWYIVKSSKTFECRLTTSGNVHLILCDGATLTCESGIRHRKGDTLSIYGQSGNSGKLICSGDIDSYYAAVGGNSEKSGGDVTVYGGDITANGGKYGAGIGGGYRGDGGAFTLYGGKVDANGGKEA